MEKAWEWFKGLRLRIKVALIILVILVIWFVPPFIKGFNEGWSELSTTTTTVSSSAETILETTTEPPVTATTTEKPKAWVKVFAFSGNSKKRSDTFTLTGAKARINYSTKGMCYIYIVDEGDSLEKPGGFPEVQINDAASGSSMLAKGAGSYYIDVNGNAAFSIVIEEYR